MEKLGRTEIFMVGVIIALKYDHDVECLYIAHIEAETVLKMTLS